MRQAIHVCNVHEQKTPTDILRNCLMTTKKDQTPGHIPAEP